MDTLEALGTALKRETDGHKFYSEAAAKATEPKGKHLFEWMAAEEKGHIAILQQSIKEVKDNSKWPTQNMWGSKDHISDPIDISEFPPKSETMGNILADAPEVEIIKKAIEAEKLDATFYTELAERVDDPNGKIILKKLAHVEEGHRKLLEEEYEWIRHSKDLFTLHRFLPAG